MHNFCWPCGGIQLGGKYIYYKLCWSWVGMTAPRGFFQVLHTTWCKPHLGPTQETTWLLSAYGTSGQPGEAKPNSSQAQTKPPRYSRACCRKLLFEEVELLLGWLALACESRLLLSCQATFRRFPPFRHDDLSYGMLECCKSRGRAWLGNLYMLTTAIIMIDYSNTRYYGLTSDFRAYGIIW